MAAFDDRLFDVDRNGTLRVPGVLWLAMAFLSRHVLISAVAFALAKRSPDVMRLIDLRNLWFMLLIELPAVALMVAAANRTPDAGLAWRWIWKHGRAILIGMAAVHVFTAGWVLAHSEAWRTWPELFFASCALLDLAIAWSVSQDSFHRLLFSDFPTRQQASPKK